MYPQLIFFHIEKTAGTAQSALFCANYGKDDVYWLGIPPGPAKPLDVREGFSDRRILGGHFNYPDVVQRFGPLLFCGVVREPVERAVSLFNYYAHMERAAAKERWQALGLDPSSMLTTLNQCSAFRRQIHDGQNLRLSGTRRFEDTKALLMTRNFIVGTVEYLTEFNMVLGRLLNWSCTATARRNIATNGYQKDILKEDGLIERIIELNGEDAKLYRHIQSVRVFEHLPDRETLQNLLAPTSR